jgi:hypothetical protein
VMERLVKIEMIFYINGWLESDVLGRVTCCGSVDSMFQFRLKRGADGMKCCQKMKRRQRAHFDSMERKETTLVGLTRILLSQK